jgi:hypothetical protein
MSLFANILDVHTDWLTHKGYDQSGLGLTGTSYDLLNSLEDKFAEVIKSNIWARKPLKFPLDIAGNFGRGEQVKFKFHYFYDPNTIRLELLALRAQNKDQTQTWLITGNRQHLLPRSDHAYQQLVYQANSHQINRAIILPEELGGFRPRPH